MKRAVFIFLILFAVIAGLPALDSVRSVFPSLGPEYVQMLTEGTTLSNSTLNGGITHLTPYGSLMEKRAVEATAEDNSFSVAITAFAPYPEDWAGLTAEERQLRLFSIMTAVSTQKGITYISKTAGYKPKVLMEDSYCISDADNKNSRLADPVFDAVPTEYRMYSYQKDNRFGGNTFVLDYTNTENEIFLRITNHTPMKFMGVTCVAREQLSMYLDTFCTDEGIVICALATVYDRKPEVHLVVYTVDLESSFKRRITGLKDWFIVSLEQ